MNEATFSKWLLEQVPAIVISMGFIYYLISQVKKLDRLLENERNYSRIRDEQDRELINKLTLLVEDVKEQSNSCNVQVLDKITCYVQDIKSHITLTLSKGNIK